MSVPKQSKRKYDFGTTSSSTHNFNNLQQDPLSFPAQQSLSQGRETQRQKVNYYQTQVSQQFQFIDGRVYQNEFGQWYLYSQANAVDPWSPVTAGNTYRNHDGDWVQCSGDNLQDSLTPFDYKTTRQELEEVGDSSAYSDPTHSIVSKRRRVEGIQNQTNGSQVANTFSDASTTQTADEVLQETIIDSQPYTWDTTTSSWKSQSGDHYIWINNSWRKVSRDSNLGLFWDAEGPGDQGAYLDSLGFYYKQVNNQWFIFLKEKWEEYVTDDNQQNDAAKIDSIDKLLENVNPADLKWTRMAGGSLFAKISIPGIDPIMIYSLCKQTIHSKKNNATDQICISFNHETKIIKENKDSTNEFIISARNASNTLPPYTNIKAGPIVKQYEELYKKFNLGDLLYGTTDERDKLLRNVSKMDYNTVDDLNNEFLGTVTDKAYNAKELGKAQVDKNLYQSAGKRQWAYEKTERQKAAETFRESLQKYIEVNRLEFPVDNTQGSVDKRLKIAIKYAIEYTLDRGHDIRFMISGLVMNNVLEPNTGDRYNSYTSKELRSIYRRRKNPGFDRIIFLQGTNQVEAPWVSDPAPWQAYQKRRVEKLKKANLKSRGWLLPEETT